MFCAKVSMTTTAAPWGANLKHVNEHPNLTVHIYTSCNVQVDRVTKWEITSLAIGSNKKELLANSDLHIERKGCHEEEDAQIPVHLEDMKDIFSQLQFLVSSREQPTIIKAALKQAERDITEGRNTILEFQLSQKKPKRISEEQS